MRKAWNQRCIQAVREVGISWPEWAFTGRISVARFRWYELLFGIVSFLPANNKTRNMKCYSRSRLTIDSVIFTKDAMRRLSSKSDGASLVSLR